MLLNAQQIPGGGDNFCKIRKQWHQCYTNDMSHSSVRGSPHQQRNCKFKRCNRIFLIIQVMTDRRKTLRSYTNMRVTARENPILPFENSNSAPQAEEVADPLDISNLPLHIYLPDLMAAASNNRQMEPPPEPETETTAPPAQLWGGLKPDINPAKLKKALPNSSPTCRVCDVLPRNEFRGCGNGHVICENCQRTTQTCPTCNSSPVNYHIWWLNMIMSSLVSTKQTCQYAPCRIQLQLQSLGLHEELCCHRMLNCPKKNYGGGCEVTVPYNIYLNHIQECCTVMRHPNWKGDIDATNLEDITYFRGTLKDFGLGRDSVFNRSTSILFPPIVFLSNRSVLSGLLVLYIVRIRDEKKWFFFLQCQNKKPISNQWKINLKIFKHNHEAHHSWESRTVPMSVDTPSTVFMEIGCAQVLTDSMIHSLMPEDPRAGLFDFSVAVQYDSNLYNRCSNWVDNKGAVNLA